MKYVREEWIKELKKRFGDDKMKWAFKCPACGKVTTMQEFKNAGAKPNDSFQNCIGRFTGKGSPTTKNHDGCNWAAYGLFGTMDKGDTVIADDGDEIQVFAMADGGIEL